MSKIPAGSLVRNDSVKVAEGELPYLVDAVTDAPDDRVRVTFSSGDTIEYPATEDVWITD